MAADTVKRAVDSASQVGASVGNAAKGAVIGAVRGSSEVGVESLEATFAFKLPGSPCCCSTSATGARAAGRSCRSATTSEMTPGPRSTISSPDPGLRASRIGLLGISQGGAAAILAAADSDEVQAVAAEASFRSVDSAVAQSFSHFVGLPAFPFAPITVWLAERRTGIDTGGIVPEQTVAELSPTPLLVMHGLDDVTISPADGEAIFAAAGEPKELWLIPGAEHSEGAAAAPDAYRRRIVAFFEDNLSGRQARPRAAARHPDLPPIVVPVVKLVPRPSGLPRGRGGEI